MVNSKVSLMISNSNDINNVNGTLGMNIFKKCSALTLTLQGKVIDVEKVNRCRDIIKNNTSIFSNFRGNNLLITSVNLSLEENPEEALTIVLNIYENLKKSFFTSQYLVLASWVIYKSRHRIDVNEAIINTRKAYDSMKSNHVFLTGADDVTAAAIIATTSTNLDKTLDEIERCYSTLKNNGFWASNNLQALSHILSISSDDIEDKCNAVANLSEALKKYSVPVKNYGLPILGVVTMVTREYDLFASNVAEVVQILKSNKGFGIFSMDYTIRNMIATAIVTAAFIDDLDDNLSTNLSHATSNIALTIILAMEAATVAATSAAAAAAASSAN